MRRNGTYFVKETAILQSYLSTQRVAKFSELFIDVIEIQCPSKLHSSQCRNWRNIHDLTASLKVRKGLEKKEGRKNVISDR